jgi:putative ABC transport system permease protein
MSPLFKDFAREVANSRSRFISILILAALAVAFLCGLRATAPDMKNTLDAYMDEREFMDIRVLSTLGITEEDVQAVLARDEIEKGEGVYQLDAHALGGGSDIVVKLWSMPKELNLLELKEGEWPSGPNDCLADKQLMAELGLSVGDIIELQLEEDEDPKDPEDGSGAAESDGKDDEDEDDEDSEPRLRYSQYRICGVAASPYYISVERGTGSIGTGSIGAFVYLQEEAFDMDYYAAAFFTVKGARELTAFSGEYDALIDGVIDGMEDFAEERAALRYDDVVGEAAEKLDDAQAELDDASADAEKELSDARDELADARKELADARQELADAKQELADALQEIEDGKKELADAKQELKDKVADAEKEIADGEKEIADALKELHDGEKEYADGLKEYEKGLEKFEAGDAELADGASSLADAKKQIDSSAPMIAQMRGGRAALAAGIAQAQAQRDGYEAQLEFATPPAIRMQLGYAIGAIDSRISELEAQLEQIDAGIAAYDEGLAQYESGMKELKAGQNELDRARKKLEDAKKELDDGRRELDDGWKEYYDGLEELEDAKKTLDEEVADAERKIADAEQELADGEKEYADGVAEYRDGVREYEDGLKEYQDGLKEYEDAEKEADEEIADAQSKLDDAREKLGKIDECDWYVMSRDSNPGYLGFGQDADRMANLAKVFPMLFFLVAALVCLTTMTRMVEEQRTQIGALKALGYSRAAISAKYIAYGVLPSLAGGLLGLAIGYTLFPKMIFTAYQIMYEVPDIQLRSYPAVSVLSVLAACACTGLASLWGCFYSLSEVPAQLMRPKAPAAGKRIFLERIGPVWSRLSFFRKLTARNLFRYKKRFWMTVAGIGGCTALIIAGFGLRSSLLSTMDRQFDELFKYDVMLSMAGDPSAEERAGIEAFLRGEEIVTDSMPVLVSSVTCESDSYRVDGIMEACDPEELSRMVELRTFRPKSDGEPLELTDEGVIIGQKLSELLGVGPGETFIIDNGDGRYRVRVAAVNEHYLAHYFYMTRDYYEMIFEEEWEPTSYILKLADGSKESCDSLFESFMKLAGAGAASRIVDTRDTYHHSMERIDFVVVVVILSAAALAMVVLYNLSSINITERKRELATIKVLGFFDGEVSAYIYRENIVLTMIGIALGIVMGHWLHAWLVKSVEIDLMMFGRDTDPMSYLWASLLTALFSALVNVIAHFRMKKIDMATSLKSAE